MENEEMVKADKDNSTVVGRFLEDLPLPESLKDKISNIDFYADKALDVKAVVFNNGEKFTPAELAKHPELVGVKGDLLKTVLAGGKFLLEHHQFKDLTEDENKLADEIALKSLELSIRIGLRNLKK